MDISNWVVFSSLVSAAGVLAAVCIAVAGTRERANHRKLEQAAEARMFLVRGADLDPSWSKVHWLVEHHGPHPVLSVQYEAWPTGNPRTERPAYAAHRDAVWPLAAGDDPEEPGRYSGYAEIPVHMRFDRPRIERWQVSWTDRYGNQWALNRPGAEPARIHRRSAARG